MKSSANIELLKIAGQICADCLSYLSLLCKPGISTLELDKKAEEFIRDCGAIPATIGYHGYKYSICTSVNSGCVHCEPNNKPLLPGSIVKLDLVVDYKGWKADSAISVLIPPVKPEVRKLAEITYLAMLAGISEAKEGNKVFDVSKAIYDARIESGVTYGVIKEFTGHGIGQEIHEAPQIPNYPVKEKDSLLVAGQVICIEPIFCIGDPAIFYDPKQWDTYMLSGNSAAHFEHTILITPQGPEILTIRNNEKIP